MTTNTRQREIRDEFLAACGMWDDEEVAALTPGAGR